MATNKKAQANGAAGDQPKAKSIEDIAAETLVGDISDIILMELRAPGEKKPWAKMNEREQAAAIERAQKVAHDLVRRTVRIVATRGFETIPTIIEDAKIKKGELQIKVKGRVTSESLALLAEKAEFVQVVFASVEDFGAGVGSIKAEPDQGDLMRDAEPKNDGPVRITDLRPGSGREFGAGPS